MKIVIISVAAIPLLLIPSAVYSSQKSDTAANMAWLGQKVRETSAAEADEYKAHAKQISAIGASDANAKREYAAALNSYNARRVGGSVSGNATLLREYQKLEALYIKAVTNFIQPLRVTATHTFLLYR